MTKTGPTLRDKALKSGQMDRQLLNKLLLRSAKGSSKVAGVDLLGNYWAKPYKRCPKQER